MVFHLVKVSSTLCMSSRDSAAGLANTLAAKTKPEINTFAHTAILVV